METTFAFFFVMIALVICVAWILLPFLMLSALGRIEKTIRSGNVQLDSLNSFLQHHTH